MGKLPGGHREEFVESLVAVVLVTDVSQRQPPGPGREACGIGRVDQRIGDHGHHRHRPMGGLQCRVADHHVRHLTQGFVSGDLPVGVPQHGRGAQGTGVVVDQLVLPVKVAGVPRSAAWCGVTARQGPAPFAVQQVDIGEAGVPGVGQGVAGLGPITVGLQEHDVVAAGEKFLNQRPAPEPSPIGGVNDARAEEPPEAEPDPHPHPLFVGGAARGPEGCCLRWWCRARTAAPPPAPPAWPGLRASGLASQPTRGPRPRSPHDESGALRVSRSRSDGERRDETATAQVEPPAFSGVNAREDRRCLESPGRWHGDARELALLCERRLDRGDR